MKMRCRNCNAVLDLQPREVDGGWVEPEIVFPCYLCGSDSTVETDEPYRLAVPKNALPSRRPAFERNGRPG